MAMAKTPGTAYICAQCIRAQLLLRQGYLHRSRPRQLLPYTAVSSRRWQTNKTTASDTVTKGHGDDAASAAASSRTTAVNGSSITSDGAETSSTDLKATGHSTSEPGVMSRRLQEATEEAILTGGRSGRTAVEDAGFSEELKERLFARVQEAKFRSENAAAFAEAGLPNHIDKGTYLTATTPAWTGTESTEDAVLRMLNDTHKPLARELRGRGRPKMPDLKPIDVRIRAEPKASPGQRVADARERALAYTGLGLKQKTSKGLTEDERDAMRAEFRERFKPAGRTMPATLTGLASLANERIEDAIARGQFKNIPRGKGIERDTRADNPFIDTTEYIMNKMIKQQNIVPPWIDKQQELVKALHVFRSRMRDDWRRHAARSIASKGGTLEEQIRRARRYALAEEIHNPAAVKKFNIEEAVSPAELPETPTLMNVQQQLSQALAQETDPSHNAHISKRPASTTTENAQTVSKPVEEEDLIPLSTPFRDPAWLALEKSYMELSIANINSLTRAYNLMAPELAKKPYYSLERELNRCYAEVAPQLAETIRERATTPAKRPAGEGAIAKAPSILDRFGTQTSSVKVYDSKEPHYGLKEMWRDLFKDCNASK